jgi:hypothetical protein
MTELLQIEDIIVYIQENGGKVTNNALVKNFKQHLTHPANATRNKNKLKEYVGKIARIQIRDDVKLIVLKSDYANLRPQEIVEMLDHEKQQKKNFTTSTAGEEKSTADPDHDMTGLKEKGEGKHREKSTQREETRKVPTKSDRDYEKNLILFLVNIPL